MASLLAMAEARLLQQEMMLSSKASGSSISLIPCIDRSSVCMMDGHSCI